MSETTCLGLGLGLGSGLGSGSGSGLGLGIGLGLGCHGVLHHRLNEHLGLFHFLLADNCACGYGTHTGRTACVTQVQAWTVLVCRCAQYMVPSFFGNPSIRARSPSSVSCSAVWVVAASAVEEGRWGAPGAVAATAVGAEARGKRVTTRATVGAKWERLLLRRDLLGQLRVVSGLLSAQAWRDMEDRWRDAWLGGRPR